MPNYYPINNPGEARRRSHEIIIQHPTDGNPQVHFREQDQILLANGDSVYIEKGGFGVDVNQVALERVYPIIDPDTGEQLGEIDGKTLFAAFVSFYLATANDRDAQLQPQD